MKKVFQRTLSVLLVLTTLFGSLAFGGMVASAATDDPIQSVVNGRYDGNWLWPLAVPFASKQFSDWAGCSGPSACPFHPDGCRYNPSCVHSSTLGHNGVDIGNGDVQYGTEVLAANPGYAYFKDSTSGARGRTVVIEHPTGYGFSYYSYYQHLSEVCFTIQGQYVQAGDVIGKVGRSGYGYEQYKDYGKHLHFSVVIGEEGLGEKYKNNVSGLIDTEISSIEKKGWLTTPGIWDGEDLKVGRVVTNPDVANVNEIGASKGACNAPHCGSVHYVDRNDARTLEFNGKSNDDKTDYTFKVEGTTVTLTLTNKNINKKATWKEFDGDGNWQHSYSTSSSLFNYPNKWNLWITIPDGSREISITDTKAYNIEIKGYNYYLYDDNKKFACTSTTVSGNTLTVVFKTDEEGARQLRYRISGQEERNRFGYFVEELLTGKRNSGSGANDPGSQNQDNPTVLQKFVNRIVDIRTKVLTFVQEAITFFKKLFWFGQ